MLEPGRNCWRVERADRFAVVIDAEHYFAVAREAFLRARHRIMLVGWDFDARIVLDPTLTDDDGPRRVGEFLLWLVERRPELEIFLLRWDLGALKSVFRGSTLPTILRFARHPRIHVKLDAHHPTGSSHHQKLVSIDDSFAFCGGIDMTNGRWDTRHHRDEERLREGSFGQTYEPWHDATTAISGDAARALAQACRDRWQRAGGREVRPLAQGGDCWPPALEPTLRDVQVGIARTQPEMPDTDPLHEVEALFLDQVASARRYLYCESQYFASRRIAEAIGRRLEEADGPEFVIVNPVSAQGWLEPLAMDTARARLVTALRAKDRRGRLRLYHPRAAGGTPIYAHAKVTIVDDCQLRIGSANLNNRSLRLDTECDVVVDAALARGDAGLRRTIASVRDDLLAEHLDVPVARVSDLLAQCGSLVETIEQLRGAGRSLVPYEIPDVAAVEAFLADHELLDPESPDEMFEPLSRRGLLRHLPAFPRRRAAARR
jgi:phosphatidylserine/phosphatidylglycerophosphate/cardiolipin synthase-like enzyme